MSNLYKDISSIGLKSSASHICNNLTSNGTCIAYVHQNEVQIFSESAINNGKKNLTFKKAATKDTSFINQAKWVKIAGKPYLVVAFTQSLEILDGDAARILFSFPFPTNEGVRCYGSGICSIFDGKDGFVLVGCSSGEIYGFELKKTIKLVQHLSQHKAPITELTNDQTTLEMWASADQTGKIVVWKNFIPLCSFDGYSDSYVTSLAMRADTVIASYSSGHVRLFALNKKTCVVEVTAHSQMINAIHLHPTKDLFVTVSDDTFMNVFSFKPDASKETLLVVSYSVTNFLLCGVQFCGDKYASIAAAAYDSMSLPIWSGSSK